VLPPSKKLPAKITKLLARKTGRLGIRVPDDELSAAILEMVGSPLLVSSAYIENKPGATSAAAVRQRFDRSVDVWIDAGDIRTEPPSTLIDISETGWELIREGAIARAVIERALA